MTRLVFFNVYLCSEDVNHELSLLNLSLQDPKEKLILNLKREIKLLRTENAYFRQQVFSVRKCAHTFRI